jgi:penicillin-binding protein 2
MKNPFELENSSFQAKKGKSLEWEESAVDQEGDVDEIFDQQRSSFSFYWLKFAVLGVFLVIVFRLGFLQIVQGQKFRNLSENNRIRKQPILAPRGFILDRNNQILAENTASFNLVAIPFDLPKIQLQDQLVKLSKIFSFDYEEVSKKIKSSLVGSVVPVIVKQNLSLEENILFQTRATEFVGFSVQEVPVRKYPLAEMFSHVLGYAGLINQEDLKKFGEKYEAYDFIGKLGIEQQYENFLHGINGSNLVEVDATGKLLDVLGEEQPHSGNSLVLNIDKDLQERLFIDLSAKLPNRRAAAVVLNPKNGQILALVSVPGFDNNLFAKGIKQEDYKNLLADKRLPLFNRAIAGTYPPGSTVKPMVAAAALQEKVVSESTIIYDRGVLVIPNQYDPSMSYNFFGWKREGLGPMDVKSAIAKSSDIYFYTVAGGAPRSTISGLGVDKLTEYYRKFNLGKLTGIDLQGEKTGLVPDPEWKEKYYKGNAILSKWYLGDTYHIGIGQGDMLATPLQVSQWTAIIANSGVGFKPQLLNKVIDKQNNVIFEKKPEVLIENFIEPKVLKIVQEGMRQTVLAGTSQLLKTLSISSAGKTGTSQFDDSNPERTHAWFTAYAPYEDPEIVVTVLVEAGGEGNAVSVPVTRDILKWWSENRYKK